MECDESHKEKVQEFINRLHATPYASLHEPNEAMRIAQLFLRARKFDVSRAWDLYKSYRHIRYSNQLEGIDPMEEGVRRELLSEKFTVLPHSSTSEPTVIVFSVRRHWPPNCTERDVLKGIIYQLDAALMDKQTQEKGVTVIYDMTGAKYSNFSVDLSIKLLNLLTGSYPARVCNILIIAAPIWFSLPYHFSHLFVKAKIRERIFSIDQRQLSNYLPPASIPQNLGGCLCHRHTDWLKICFERLSSPPFPTGDYFDPMKASSSIVPLPSHQANGISSTRHRRRSFNTTASLRVRSFHHDEGSVILNGTLRPHGRSVSSIGRTESVRPGSTDWTCNPLHRRSLATNLSDLPGRNNDNSLKAEGGSQADSGCAAPPLVSDPGSPTRISVDQFILNFSRKSSAVFEREYEHLIKPLPHGGSITRFTSRANTSKNRYVNVPCLNESAVVLPNGAYIHANYVHGYRQRNAFILTQGPLESTIGDFWQMIWTTGATMVVMLTKIVENGRTKCSQYWPTLSATEGSTSSHYAPFTVTNLGETVEAGGMCRLSRLQLTKAPDHLADHADSGRTRQIDHLLFLGWPDFDVPRDARHFLAFLDVVNHHRRRTNQSSRNPPPLVIHCSAGIGRTGTFTAIDICLAQARAEGCVDVPGVVSQIRRQRACAVQMAKQYAFIYRAVYTRLQHDTTT